MSVARALPVLVVVLAWACTAAPPVVRVPTAAPERSGTPAPSAAPERSPIPTPSAAPAPHGPLLACGEEADAAIRAVLGASLTAMRTGGWDDALALTSAQFRADFDAAGLAALITGSYPTVAANTGHQVLGCRSDGQIGEATVLVEAGEDTTLLRYLLVLEGGAWRIAGAAEPEGATI